MQKALFSLIALVFCITSASSQSQPTNSELGQIQHGSVLANGVRLHYVVAGKGDPVILLSGWPETWFTWRHMIPELARAGRRVYAVEPRGFGDSDKPAGGYDPVTAAKDLHAVIEVLGLSSGPRVDIVGHDVGTWIAYAHATAFPGDIRRLVLTEAAIPGVSVPAGGVPSQATNVKTWQFSFNRLDDLPEILVQGHERAFIEWLFANKTTRRWAIAPAELDEYVRAFSSPGRGPASCITAASSTKPVWPRRRPHPCIG